MPKFDLYVAIEVSVVVIPLVLLYAPFHDDSINDGHVIFECSAWSYVLLYLIFVFRPAWYYIVL